MGLLGWNKNTPAAKDAYKPPELGDEVDTSLPLRNLLYFDFDVLPVVFIEFDGEKTIIAVEQSDGAINPLEFSLTPKQQHQLAKEYIDWRARQ
jgi:hypothetical protein